MNYFESKAKAVFLSNGWDPDLSANLASWAEGAKLAVNNGDTAFLRRGVVVDSAGTLIALWGRTNNTTGNVNAAHIAMSTFEELVGLELGLAMARLSTALPDGRQAVSVSYWEVATGPGNPQDPAKQWDSLTAAAKKKAEDRAQAMSQAQALTADLKGILRAAETAGEKVGKGRADLVRATEPAGHTNWRKTVDRMLS